MENSEEPKEQPQSPTVADVSPIQEGRNSFIFTREQIKDLVEQPLVAACEDMWDKNIRTLSTSANRKDIETGEAYIIIDFDSLSEENQKAAREYTDPIEYDNMTAVKIVIQVSESTTTDEISGKAAEITASFRKQQASWIPTYTIDDLKRFARSRRYEVIPDDPEYWSKETGYYYDNESKRFYYSEEHYKKANEEIDND